jgi:hypothetical protein
VFANTHLFALSFWGTNNGSMFDVMWAEQAEVDPI